MGQHICQDPAPQGLARQLQPAVSDAPWLRKQNSPSANSQNVTMKPVRAFKFFLQWSKWKNCQPARNKGCPLPNTTLCWHAFLFFIQRIMCTCGSGLKQGIKACLSTPNIIFGFFHRRYRVRFIRFSPRLIASCGRLHHFNTHIVFDSLCHEGSNSYFSFAVTPNGISGVFLIH